MRAGQSALATPASNAAGAIFSGSMARSAAIASAGIVELVAAEEPRRRQVEQAGFVLIDQPAALLGGGPILAGDLERRAERAGLPLDHGERVARLRGRRSPARRA